MIKIEGSGSESGSTIQRHGSADPDPDPDPHQNVMDPQDCLQGIFAPVQHPVRDDADAGVERGGGGPHPGDLQALREQAARHDHGEDRNQGTRFFPLFKTGFA